jgi:hypothetical protein
MHALLAKALEAHGGLDNWRRYGELTANAVNDGALWGIKQQAGYAQKTVGLAFDLRRQVTRHSDFVTPGIATEITPERVRIFSSDGALQDERERPRSSFAGHTLETPWDRIQLAYFSGYAMWSYLTTPFLLADPGFILADAPSWFENGEEWQGLNVSFPEQLAYHSKDQTFYFDRRGILRRHDYDVDIAKGARGAHYMLDYATVQGFEFPRHHVIRIPGPDNKPMPEPVVVDVKLTDIVLK